MSAFNVVITVIAEDEREVNRTYKYTETTDYTEEVHDIINTLEKEL